MVKCNSIAQKNHETKIRQNNWRFQFEIYLLQTVLLVVAEVALAVTSPWKPPHCAAGTIWFVPVALLAPGIIIQS